jgi:hypothetical protein
MAQWVAAFLVLLCVFVISSANADYDYSEAGMEKARYCMFLSMDYNNNNHRPIGMAMRSRKDLDPDLLEERLVWDIFFYCLNSISDIHITAIRQAREPPKARHYFEILKFDVDQYKTNDDLIIETEWKAYREMIKDNLLDNVFRLDENEPGKNREEVLKHMERMKKIKEEEAQKKASEDMPETTEDL